MEIPSTVFKEIPQLKILRALARKKKLKVYLVGGFLRDCLLGCPCRDLDFAVSRSALKLARDFAKDIKGAFVLLDDAHGCARVVKKYDSEIFTFDFADFRDKTILGDLAHRDFTINTLCFDIEKLETAQNISDILIEGKNALKDLKTKTIRMVSKKSFKEDPLRMVRAFSLKALLNFQIDKPTLSAIKKGGKLLKGVAYERIRDELFKVLSAPGAFDHLKMMDTAGLLERIIPQVKVMYGCRQGGYHHLDVWPHSLETVKQLEGVFDEVKNHSVIWEYLNESLAGDRTRLTLLKLAALLHDIGKPQTKRQEKGRTSFHGHEHVGRGIVRHIANLLKLSVKERHALENMVLWHLRPGYLSNFKMPSQRAVFRYFRDTKEEGLSILLLSLADQRSTRGPLTTGYDQKHHEEIIQKLIRYDLAKRQEKPFVRLINGHDLIRKLKLKPSPIFAKILREIEERQATGEVTTKEEALRIAKTIADSVERIAYRGKTKNSLLSAKKS